MGLPKDNNPLAAQRVKLVHTYHDVSGHNVTVSGTSATMATLTGATITDNIGSLFVSNVGNGMLYVEPESSAGPDSFPIPPGAFYELMGRADELRLSSFYSTGSTTMAVMYREVYQ